MTLKTLEKIVKELTGLKLITFNDPSRSYEYDFMGRNGTSVTCDMARGTIKHIFLNIQEIRDATREHFLRGFGTDNIYLKVILHEIAHVRQIKKCVDLQEFDGKYNMNAEHYEDMADRYARLTYKKVLYALDKQEKVCYALSKGRK